MGFISDDGGVSYNRCHFWSNFEIGDLDFWRGEAYTKGKDGEGLIADSYLVVAPFRAMIPLLVLRIAMTSFWNPNLYKMLMNLPECKLRAYIFLAYKSQSANFCKKYA